MDIRKRLFWRITANSRGAQFNKLYFVLLQEKLFGLADIKKVSQTLDRLVSVFLVVIINA